MKLQKKSILTIKDAAWSIQTSKVHRGDLICLDMSKNKISIHQVFDVKLSGLILDNGLGFNPYGYRTKKLVSVGSYLKA